MVTADTSMCDSRIAARSGDPSIGVHCLTEFVFCARAGLCAYEQEKDDDETPLKPSTSYLPIYHRERLARQLSTQLSSFWTALIALLLLSVMETIAIWNPSVPLWAPLILPIPIGLTASVAIRSWNEARLCRQILRIYEAAEPRLPDPRSTDPERVHWCELRAAVATVTNPPSKYSDRSLRLSGKPKVVLQDGSLRIPVFFHRGGSRGIHRQHLVRMAAYCHLIETCEGGWSPYGVAIWADTFDGVSIPTNPESLMLLQDELQRARRIVRAAQESDEKPPPPHPSLCTNCRLGVPKLYRPGLAHLRHGKPLPVFQTFDGEEEVYHSHCGDRFRWLPPHEGTRDLDLHPW